MEFTVNIDAGFAINTKTVAALIRNKDNPELTDIILVSGNKFTALHPLSSMIEMLKEDSRSKYGNINDLERVQDIISDLVQRRDAAKPATGR